MGQVQRVTIADSLADTDSPWLSILELLDLGIGATSGNGREDLKNGLQIARDRLARPHAVVAVVGEFKKGKSSLVNALLGEAVCPVDDDIATTAVTFIRHGEAPQIRAWRRGSDSPEDVAFLGEIAASVRELGQMNEVERLDVELPNQFLAGGIALIDTPGAGAASRHAALALAFLKVADALLFVTDASAPLSGDELSFLTEATSVCPVVLFCLAKTDLYPRWRDIQQLDAASLHAAQLPVMPVPVSAALRLAALSIGDAQLNAESGFPELLESLDSGVLRSAKRFAAYRALFEVEAGFLQLRQPLGAELEALRSPESTAAALEDLRAGRARLDKLRQAGSRWGTVLSEGFADLSTESDYKFRSALRDLNRKIDALLETADPRKDWRSVTDEIRADMAFAVRALVRELEEGAAKVGRAVATVIAEDDPGLDLPTFRTPQLDIGRYWSEKEQRDVLLLGQLGLGYASLKGAQGGIMLVNLLGGLAGVVLSTTATLGVGALFGGKQIWDERNRRMSQRRQQARGVIRQFIDDIQFEASKTTRDLVRDLQRMQREYFAEELTQRMRTQNAVIEASQRGAEAAEGTRLNRIAELQQMDQAIESILQRVASERAGL